jgi:uncharacterized membrane protein
VLASEARTGACRISFGGFIVVSFGILGILYSAVLIAISALAVYALVLVVIFLRLRIRELKATQTPDPGNDV